MAGTYSGCADDTPLQGIPRSRQTVASIYPQDNTDWHGFSPSSRQSRANSSLGSTPWLCQCSARAAQDIWEHHRPAVVSRMLALFGMTLSTSEKLVNPAPRGKLGTTPGRPLHEETHTGSPPKRGRLAPLEGAPSTLHRVRHRG